jgi:hypothetical protein
MTRLPVGIILGSLYQTASALVANQTNPISLSNIDTKYVC